MKQDVFRIDGIDEGTGYVGWHNPNFRWNGWACPYFTFETCQQLSEWVNAGAKDDPSLERFYAIDGKVWHELDGERYDCPTRVVDGVTLFAPDGWVWYADSDREDDAE